MKLSLLAAAVLSLAGLRADAAEKPRVVLLPFANLSGVERAQGALVPTLALKLTSKGWDVVRGEAVEEFIQKERIRYVDSVTPELRKKLLAALSAEALVTGSIYSFAEGDNSVVSISARMLRTDGTTGWSAVVGLTSEETEGLLGLGRAGPLPQLAERSLDTLLRKFPAPGARAAAEPRGTPLLKSSPPTYKSKSLAGTAVRRVCLLPFENFTPVREAPRVLSDVLQHELVASGRFEVVEAAELRAALVAEKIRGLAGLENGRLAALGKRIGTSLFVRGTVYRYGDPAAKNGASTPEIDVELALLDADAGRIVWMGENARKGRDYKGIFQLGALRSVVALADQVLGEVVTAEGKATPKDFPSQLARRRLVPEPSETTVKAGRIGGGG